jgi:hypothetical protein
MRGMSTNSRHQSRNRTPAGVPTGGQFAAERKADAGPSTLTPTGNATFDWLVGLQQDAAAQAAQETQRPRHKVPPEDIRDPLTTDRVHTLGRSALARKVSRDAHDLAAETNRAEHPGLAFERDTAAHLARRSAQHATVLHAAGLDEHPSRFTSRVERARATLAWADEHDMGKDSREVSREEVAEILTEGQRVERADFTSRTPTTLTVAGHSADGSSTYLLADGSDPRTDGYTSEGWGDACLVQDDRGNLIALDEETAAPRVIYRILGSG